MRRSLTCEECQYFPAYPVATDSPRQTCIMAYEDDFLYSSTHVHPTRGRGHDATLLGFPSVGRGRQSRPRMGVDELFGDDRPVVKVFTRIGQCMAEDVGGDGSELTRPSPL